MWPALASLAAVALAAAASRDIGAPRYPAFACFAAAVALVGLAFGVESAPLAALGVVCGLVVEIDRRRHLIPDLLVAAIILLAPFMPFDETLLSRLGGAAALGGLFYAVRALSGAHALGFGDVKLAAAMGALLGLMDAFLAVALAGAATLIVLGLNRRRGAPFGIGLAAATAAMALLKATVS